MAQARSRAGKTQPRADGRERGGMGAVDFWEHECVVTMIFFPRASGQDISRPSVKFFGFKQRKEEGFFPMLANSGSQLALAGINRQLPIPVGTKASSRLHWAPGPQPPA